MTTVTGQSDQAFTPTKQIERAKRQTILMNVVDKAQSKGESPTFAELGRRMRQDKWVVERWPNYSGQMASADFRTLMDMTREQIRTLSIPYFVRQTTILDEVTDVLLKMVKDDRRDDDTRISAANSLRSYVQQSIRLFGNEPPKEFHVKRASVHGTIDDFKRLKQNAHDELISDGITVVDNEEGDVEEGEFEE